MKNENLNTEETANSDLGAVSGRLKRHKWDDSNVCVKCGLKRKARALSKNLRGYGTYLFDYNINGEWVASCPTCH